MKKPALTFEVATTRAFNLYETRARNELQKQQVRVTRVFCQGTCECDADSPWKSMICDWPFRDGGYERTLPCHFPFKYKDKTYTECTTDYDGTPWCSVADGTSTFGSPQVESDGTVEYMGLWGYCVQDGVTDRIAAREALRRANDLSVRARIYAPSKHDLRDVVVRDSLIDKLAVPLCAEARTEGCMMWDDSRSVHPCVEFKFNAIDNSFPESTITGMIGTCHSTRRWLFSFDMYVENRQREAGRVSETFWQPTAQEETVVSWGDALALFVPALNRFHNLYKLRLEVFGGPSGERCEGQSETLSDDAAAPAAGFEGQSTDRDGIWYIPVQWKAFRLVPVHRVGPDAGQDAHLVCDCRALNTESRVFGAVSSSPGALHACQACAGNEFADTVPFVTQSLCGGALWHCVSCANRGAHFLRSKDPVPGGCVQCPPLHISNHEREAASYAQRLGTSDLTLGEMLELSAERYGAPFLRSRPLGHWQDFGGDDRYTHITNATLLEGEWTCHFCPLGFRLTSSGTPTCVPLRLRRVLVIGSGDSAVWGIEVLPPGVAGQSVYEDQITTDARNSNFRPVPADAYLNMSVLRAEGIFREEACPAGPAVGGRFRYLCGASADNIAVRVVRAEILNAGVGSSWGPAVDDELVFRRSTSEFYFVDYAAANMGTAAAPDMALLLAQQYNMPSKPVSFADYALDIAREGTDLACWRCVDGQYNSACSNDGGGAFGACTPCKTSAPTGRFLAHARDDGCDGWSDPSVFVDSDWQEEPCRGVLREDGRLRLCVGFCGQRADFTWWTPWTSNTDLDETTNADGAVIERRLRTNTCPKASTATDSGCQHPDTGEPFAPAGFFRECSDTLPYCAPGWYVDAECVARHRDADNGELLWNAACCKMCQQRCEPGQRRRADWEVCPGDTAADTQARCGQGCDVNFYLDTSAGEEGQCRMCESCLEGVRV